MIRAVGSRALEEESMKAKSKIKAGSNQGIQLEFTGSG
jgi:hypothetical protein